MSSSIRRYDHTRGIWEEENSPLGHHSLRSPSLTRIGQWVSSYSLPTRDVPTNGRPCLLRIGSRTWKPIRLKFIACTIRVIYMDIVEIRFRAAQWWRSFKRTVEGKLGEGSAKRKGKVQDFSTRAMLSDPRRHLFCTVSLVTQEARSQWMCSFWISNWTLVTPKLGVVQEDALWTASEKSSERLRVEAKRGFHWQQLKVFGTWMWDITSQIQRPFLNCLMDILRSCFWWAAQTEKPFLRLRVFHFCDNWHQMLRAF